MFYRTPKAPISEILTKTFLVITKLFRENLVFVDRPVVENDCGGRYETRGKIEAVTKDLRRF